MIYTNTTEVESNVSFIGWMRIMIEYSLVQFKSLDRT